MPFQFSPYHNSQVAAISELMQAPAQAQARAIEQGGNAQANAALQSGAGWANAAQSIGQAVGQLPQQIQQAKAQEQITQMRGMQLAEAQQQQQGRATVDRLMQGDQMAPGDTGPRRESYLDENGLFNITKLTQALAQSGQGHQAPELLRGAEQINESITKHRALEQQAAQQLTLMTGDMAAGALKLSTITGMPLLQAMDFVVQPGIASKSIKPEQYEQTKQKIAALPVEQQPAALLSIMDAAAKLDKGDTLSEGAQHVDRYGRVESRNPKAPPMPTSASIAMDAAGGDPKKANALLHPQTPRSIEEQLLEAIASGDTTKANQIKTMIRTKAEASKDPGQIAMARELANLRADEARGRLEDRNPQSDKNQAKFEQEYRGLLSKEFSSRSGGMGLEDQKVNQAKHLLAVFEQNRDPKTGEYNIPKVLQSEVALGLARLMSPTGQVGIQLQKEFDQRTAAGDVRGLVTYVTGTPVTGNTQAVFQMLKDSIIRQGQVAEQNREKYFDAIRSQAPTDLNAERRAQLEKSLKLNRITTKLVLKNGVLVPE